MMNVERVQELIGKYNAMVADPVELKEIEALIESGEIKLEDLHELYQMDERITNLATPEPSMELDNRFYAMMKEQKKPDAKSFWSDFFAWPVLVPRLAFASITLMLGFAGGMLLRSPQQVDPQLQTLSQEVSDLKEVMMLSLLEKESPTERLKAVSLTQDMDQASKKVTTALLKTLNHDENVNVRLAALDALKPYSMQSEVRAALIRSIGSQDSPLVQISLAELMAALQEKSSVKELRKIVQSERTPADVKKQIEQSIKVLI